jgi:GLPGLI family protein
MISVKWVAHPKNNMIMKSTLLIISICLLTLTGNLVMAQNAHFTTSGTIEFEKSINMYALIKKMINKDNETYLNPALDQYKKTQPQFKKLKSTLTFSDNKVLYTPQPEEATTNNFFGSSPINTQINTIATDLENGISTTQKKIFEEVFLVKDSLRKINWKITDETREVAGFQCRRANALIMDSIYVVAFYTEEIAVSGGPESFSGLPGMILGVALPHDNMSWFATKVTDVSVPPAKLAPPAKGKPVNNKTLITTLKAATADWGTQSQMILKAALL